MCGIAGEIRFDGNRSNLDNTKEMCRLQAHRGPDDEGFFADGAVTLGIRRLAIIDLTKGLYPLTNEQGNMHLVFNGEIYGYSLLRRELIDLGHEFASDTDAETVVHGYEQWGTGCLRKLNGMFAFVLWDGQKQVLFVVRDHFGIKPLYYHRNEKFFRFASEIKPLLGNPEVKYGPCESVIREYLETGLVDIADRTFFDGIFRVMPAQYLIIDLNGNCQTQTYWKPSVSSAIDGSPSPTEIQRTRDLFLEAVDRQIISDVSVGTCLSGGIDSSSIVCTIKKMYPKGAVSTGDRVRTFSAVFPGSRIDESEYISEVCEQTQSESNRVTPTADEFWSDLRTIVRCQEEPFISPSVYAQWRVMKLAKEHGLTVMLDGQGGDELLAGYDHYYPQYLMTLKRHRRFLTLSLESLRSIDINWPFLKSYLRNFVRNTNNNGQNKVNSSNSYESRVRAGDLASGLQMDVLTISLPALLRYEDKNSMYHGIEARVPFLDREFFTYIASLPLSYKLRKGITKYVFRLAMSGILPERVLTRRKKIGFEIPERQWIEHLRDRMLSFFEGEMLATGYYDLQALRNLLDKPILSDNEIRRIWRILNLEVWYREFFIHSKQS